MEHLFAVKYAWLIPLLPLLGAAVSGFFGARWLKAKSHWPIWIGVGCSAIISFSLLFGMLGLWNGGGHGDEHAGEHAAKVDLSFTKVVFDWITAGNPKGEAGDQFFNVYDPASRTWRRLLDEPLFTGEGQRNAYFHGPVRDAAGGFHLCWVWRDTPDCATNHDLSYARSADLVRPPDGGRGR